VARRVKQSEITSRVSQILWGRAAGRCQFSGCNRPLWKSPVTQEAVNLAERAHIYAASEDGPRGLIDIEPKSLNSLCNLMLVCHDCHKKIDADKDGGRYPDQLLLAWKAEHEARIERVAGIDPSKRSHLVLYGAPIGSVGRPLSFGTVAPALFPERYPAEDRAINLQMVNSSWRDVDPEFWRIEEVHLRRQFAEKITQRLDVGELEHLSVFGLAPQPLLILLGTLLTDIPTVDVYQLHREPPSWRWEDSTSTLSYSLTTGEPSGGPLALVFSLSGTVVEERIRRALGPIASIWQISIDQPNNDFMKAKHHLRAFRQITRRALDQMKAVYGSNECIHVFPAMPVSAAIEFGRVRMPKADSPWIIYEQNNSLGGFTPAMPIGTSLESAVTTAGGTS